MEIKDFQITLTNSDSEVLSIKHIGVIENWDDAPEDFNDDFEYDFVFDHSEIKDYALANPAAPDIEESICQVLKRHLEI